MKRRLQFEHCQMDEFSRLTVDNVPALHAWQVCAIGSLVCSIVNAVGICVVSGSSAEVSS